MPDADVLRLKDTLLFQTLLDRENGVGDHQLSEQVVRIVELTSPVLARVPDHLPEFTLHDAEHSARVADLMPQFIPQSTLAKLNPVEITILLASAYLHDVGMACSVDEREQICRSDAEFAKFRAGRGPSPEDPLQAKFYEDRLFGEFLRSHHAKRAGAFISYLATKSVPLTWKGAPFHRLVSAVCESHELPATALANTVKWPRDALVRNARVNVQYLAVVLRLADILDLDPERAPGVLLDFVNPRDPTSREHWLKHRAILGWDVTPEHVRLSAECFDPACERAIREYIDAIEDERRESLLLLGSIRDQIGAQYHLDLTEPVVKSGVTNDGSYIYSDLRFSVDFRRVLDLLAGVRLYGDPELALREVLQNSVDAVRMRQKLEQRRDRIRPADLRSIAWQQLGY